MQLFGTFAFSDDFFKLRHDSWVEDESVGIRNYVNVDEWMCAVCFCRQRT